MTFGLWAQRATTAPLRDIVAIIPDCECKGMNSVSYTHLDVYKRQEVASLDVYDYLLNGKYNTNIRLEENDMGCV